ncbi:hypothetical protein CEXT_47961 [Caerostris extrusa]|uniref:Uncharacterized protein n=1 Tax=Caerostris extrusa TaxID=172846 RepID=A0AAV4T9Q5_CAEEX|nr:hypothetical protein CEXT_47961 [Caerostris extrusa]
MRESGDVPGCPRDRECLFLLTDEGCVAGKSKMQEGLLWERGGGFSGGGYLNVSLPKVGFFLRIHKEIQNPLQWLLRRPLRIDGKGISSLRRSRQSNVSWSWT